MLLGGIAFAAAIMVEFAAPLWMHGPTVLGASAPGIGIGALGWLDLIFAYTLLFIAIDYLPGFRAIVARFQGIVTLILSVLALIAALIAVFALFALLMLMVSLLLATPFGTIAYFALWGDFDVSRAKTILALAMLLKLIGIGLILLASPAMLKNKGFVLLTVCSVGLTFVLGLLQTIPPGFLVSITDAICALVTAVVILIWALCFLIGSIPAILRALRSLIPG
jgi:hypothetical protein